MMRAAKGKPPLGGSSVPARQARVVDWRRIGRRLWKDKYIYLMILPVVLYFALFKYWPMWWLRIAFYDFKILKGFDGSAFVGLKHFLSFFNSMDFVRLLGNTIIINIYALLFVFPMPIVFALMLHEMPSRRFKKTVQTVSYLPHFISTVAMVAIIVNFLSPSTGLLALLFRALGADPVYVMGDARYFRSVLVVSGIWKEMGWSAILYIAVLTGIDMGLYEAAEIDGANRLQRIWHISIAGIRETIILLFILQVGNLLSTNFEKIYLLQNTSNLSVSEVLQTYVYKRGLVTADYSFGTAVGLFYSIVSFLLVALSNAISRKSTEISLW